MFVVFDLDGTLRDPKNRVDQYITGQQEIDWDAFFLACDTDTPIAQTISVLKSLILDGHRVEIWSGCCEIAREKSKQWLRAQDVETYDPECLKQFSRSPFAIPLIMRKRGDRTDDDELKPSWVELRGRPDLVFEDRNRVVEAWRKMGIMTFHVADGNF